MAKTFFRFVVLFIFFYPLIFIWAQDIDPDTLKSYELSDIVITATRTATPLFEVASSISIIDSAEIANSHKTNIYDLLRDQYGVSITQQGAPGSITQVYIRGADPSQTQILIDGINMNMANDPANTYDFADLSADNIERIEILRGPQTLYGSNAMAGVINIITKKGSSKGDLYLNTEGGSYNTYKGLLGFMGSFNRFNYSATVSKFKSNGFSSASTDYGNTEKDGTDNYTVSTRFGYDITKNFNLNLFGRFTKANTDLDQHGGYYGDDPTYKYHLEEGAYRLEGNLKLLDGKLDQKFGISFTKNLRSYDFDSTLFNPASSRSNYDGRIIKLEWQNNYETQYNNITLGIETFKESAISDYYYNDSFGPYESQFPEKSARTTGIYAEDQIKLNGNFFSSVGIRYDNHDRFGSVITYKIAPAYIIWNTGTKIKATFGTGFKAPSLFYLYDPAYGNPDLSPERSKGWDAGVEQYLFSYKATVGLNYFQNTFTDLFGFDQNFKTINVDKSETKGIELYLDIKLTNNLNLHANYTYTDSKDLSPGSVDENMPILRIPGNKASINVNYNLSEKLSFNSDVSMVGQRDDKNFSTYPATRVTLKSYTLINISTSYKISNIIQFYGRIINMLDADYEEVYGYGTAGRSGYLGMRLNLL